MVDASHGRGVQAGDHNQQTNYFVQHQGLDLGVLNTHTAADKLRDLSRDDAVIALARIPAADAAEILQALIADDENLAVSLLAHMKRSLAEAVIALFTDPPPWLADLPAASAAIAECERRSRSILGDRTDQVSYAGPSRAGTDGFYQGHVNGAICWSPKGGAHAVKADLDTVDGDRNLGFPQTDELSAGTDVWLQRFEGGTVYRLGTKLLMLPRAIAEVHEANGGTTGALGVPLREEVSNGGVIVYFRKSDRDAVELHFPSIHSSEEHGTHAVSGDISSVREILEPGLGLATSDEMDARLSPDEPPRSYQIFQAGAIFTTEGRTFVVSSAVVALLTADSRLARRLGFPIRGAEHLGSSGSRVQMFEHGLVTEVDGVAQAYVPLPAVTTPGRIPLTDHVGYGWAISPDRQFAAVSLGAAVRVLRTRDGEREADLPGRRAFLDCVAFGTDGRLVAAGGGEKVWLWDLATGEPAEYLVTGDDGRIRALAFAPNGTLAVASTMRPSSKGKAPTSVVRIYDPGTGRQLSEPVVSEVDEVTALAFAPDGMFALGTNAGTIRLHRRDALVQASGKAVLDLAYSPDGRTLVAATADAKVRFWDPATGQPAGRPDLTLLAYALAVQPNGGLLALAPISEGQSPNGIELRTTTGRRRD
jgi:hypothetical protein